MIFCFPLNFLAQPLSQVMDPFIPVFLFIHPSKPPSPSIPPSFHPLTHLPTWCHRSTHTTSLTRSPVQQPPHHLSTCSATHPPFHPLTQSLVHPSMLSSTHPPSSYSLDHLIVLSLHPTLSREPTSYLSSFIICLSCTSIYPTVHGSPPVPGPRCSLPRVVWSNCPVLLPPQSTLSLGKQSAFPTSLTAPKVTTVPSLVVLYLHLHLCLFRL